MKIIPLFSSDEALIKRALKRDAAAEKLLFDRYAPKMLSVCRYYVSDLHFAEDVLVCGFTKVFGKLAHFRGDGNFEGWIRRIMIREAIDFLRSKKRMRFSDIEEAGDAVQNNQETDIDAETLQWLIDKLPDGYRTVLVLFAIDGYSHKEISEMLQISESTSKSQLFKARRQLQQQLDQLKVQKHAT